MAARKDGERYCEDCGYRLDPVLPWPHHTGCNLPLGERREFNNWAQRLRDERWEALKRSTGSP